MHGYKMGVNEKLGYRAQDVGEEASAVVEIKELKKKRCINCGTY